MILHTPYPTASASGSPKINANFASSDSGLRGSGGSRWRDTGVARHHESRALPVHVQSRKKTVT